MDTMDTDDVDIQRIRRSSHSELVELWKREYDSANKELAKIRADFYDLRGRYASKMQDCEERDLRISKLKDELSSLRDRYSERLSENADKDLDISRLKASNKTLQTRIDQAASENEYWFKKASKLEDDGKKQRRKSTEMLKLQHDVDAEATDKYRGKAAKLQGKVGDLEINNDLMTSRNMRLTETIRKLVGTDDFEDIVQSRTARYSSDTQSSLDKKKPPKMTKAQRRRRSMAKVNELLHGLEDEVRKHNVHAQLEGQKIMKKTKAAERQIRDIQLAL